METTEALKIITALADGRDPGTGSPLPDTDPCQRPKAIRALYAAATARDSRGTTTRTIGSSAVTRRARAPRSSPAPTGGR